MSIALFLCSHLVEHDGGDAQLPAGDCLQGHQRLVDRADAIVDDDDHRQLQRAGEIGIQAVFGEWRVKTTGTLDDQPVCRVVAAAGLDQRCELNTLTLEARCAVRRQRRSVSETG